MPVRFLLVGAILLTHFAQAQTATTPNSAGGYIHDDRQHPKDPSRDNAFSMTINRYGIAATLQTLASQASASILAKGGNAVDAAIAANAAVGVIEPMMDGIGGDLFAIVWDPKDKKMHALNASGWSAKAETLAAMKAKGQTRMGGTSIYSVTVPGAVAGWAALHEKFGKLSLADDLAPAIALAENGFPVPETDSANWGEYGMNFKDRPAFAAAFLPGGNLSSGGADVPQSRPCPQYAHDRQGRGSRFLPRADRGCHRQTFR
jgi:gamma-glutamyltranspeptidase / glutathione hydrolase